MFVRLPGGMGMWTHALGHLLELGVDAAACYTSSHDVYHDLEGRGSACAAHRDDLARKWMQVPGDSDDGRRLLRDALAWHELVVLARQVDASKPL